MAVGTGFGQLFRGIGQVGGVAISAALFQSILNVELHKRIHDENAEEVSGFMNKYQVVLKLCYRS